MKRKVFCVVALAVLAAGIAWVASGCARGLPNAPMGLGHVGSYAATIDVPGTIGGGLESRVAPADSVRRSDVRQLVPSQSLPAPDEELWIVARPSSERVGPRSDEPLPGQGQLMAQREAQGKQQLVPVPLRHTDVKASVIGYVATVDVEQEYQNPYDGKIEAVYVFPL